MLQVSNIIIFICEQSTESQSAKNVEIKQ